MTLPSGYFGIEPSPRSVQPRDLEFLGASSSGLCELWAGVFNERKVVFKSLRKEFASDGTRLGILRREFEIGRSLKHPGICETLAWAQVPGLGPCIMMEWIDGESLEQVLARGRMDKDAAKKILSELCDAVSYLHHKQVVHKDLKPENIMITRMGGNVKLLDFGLSDSDSDLTGKEPGGTRFYAAPEVLEGSRADFRSDIYSLGKIIREVSGAFDGVARKCLEEDPLRRYSSVEEVKEALLASRGYGRWIWLVALTVVLVATALYAFFSRQNDPAADLFHEAVQMVRDAASTPSL